MTIIDYFGYIGSIAFCIGGIIAAKRISLGISAQFWSGISTFCFGGVFRDLILLNVSPAIFSSPLEITVTVAVGIITIIILQHCNISNKKFLVALENFLCIADSIGIAAFAVSGYGRGIKAGVLIALLCGFVTACGGGIIASAIRAATAKNIKHFTKTLADNKFYYLFGAVMSVVYGILYAFEMYSISALIIMTIIAVILGFLVSNQKLK